LLLPPRSALELMTVAGLVIKPVLVVCVRSGGALEVVKCVLVGPAWFRFGFFCANGRGVVLWGVAGAVLG
jgi:hypothetical protein